MKVKDLQDLLDRCSPDADIVIAVDVPRLGSNNGTMQFQTDRREFFTLETNTAPLAIICAGRVES